MASAIERIGTDRSYVLFMDEDTEFQMSVDLNRALQQAVREDIITRAELREFLSGRPIEVRMVDDLGVGVSGRVVEQGDRMIVYFEPDPSESLIKHEAFHVAMIAAGVPVVQQHEIMRENGWCFGACP